MKKKQRNYRRMFFNLFSRLWGYTRSNERQHVKEIIHQIGLHDEKHRKAGSLSGMFKFLTFEEREKKGKQRGKEMGREKGNKFIKQKKKKNSPIQNEKR